MYYYNNNVGDVGTKEVTMTDIAIQCTAHDNTSGNVHAWYNYCIVPCAVIHIQNIWNIYM